MAKKTEADDKWAGFSWTKFWIGKLSNKFIAWVVATVLVYITLFRNGWINPESEMAILIVWGSVTFIYMLHGAIDTAVSNAKINLEGKASVGRTTTKTTAKNIAKNIPGTANPVQSEGAKKNER